MDIKSHIFGASLLTALSLQSPALAASPPPAADSGLAARYRADAGIGADTAVVFSEDFEEKTVAQLSARWSETHNPGMLAFDKDVPPGAAPGSQSLRITSIGGVNDGGHLFLRLPKGAQDKLHLRFYVKYAQGGSYHHSGGGMGGYNPPTNYSQGQAGVRPSGSDRIVVRAERVTGTTPLFDYYAYWMEMRGNPSDSQFWGNHLINNPDVAIAGGKWACVELMVKLNNPVGARNGEAAMWIDGKEVSHLGPGFPKGKWTWDRFTPDPSGTPFEGFRWRGTEALNLNWIRLSHYVSADPQGYHGMLWFDQVVLARDHIGCLGQGVPTSLEKAAAPAYGGPSVAAGPGGALTISFFRAVDAEQAKITVMDITGRPLPGLSTSRSGGNLLVSWTKEASPGAVVIAAIDYPGGKLRKKVALLR